MPLFLRIRCLRVHPNDIVRFVILLFSRIISLRDKPKESEAEKGTSCFPEEEEEGEKEATAPETSVNKEGSP